MLSEIECITPGLKSFVFTRTGETNPSLISGVDNSSGASYVYYKTDTLLFLATTIKKLSIDVLRKHFNNIFKKSEIKNINNFVMFYTDIENKQKAESFTSAKLSNIWAQLFTGNSFTIEILSNSLLTVNLPETAIEKLSVISRKKLTEEEVEKYTSVYGDKNTFPAMTSNDAICIWYDYKDGDVIETVKRMPLTATGVRVDIRVVKSTHNKRTMLSRTAYKVIDEEDGEDVDDGDEYESDFDEIEEEEEEDY